MTRAVLALCVLAAVAGCDSEGLEPEPYTGPLTVGLEARDDLPAVRLRAADGGCDRELVVELRPLDDGIRLDVLGLGPANACDALIPATALVVLDVDTGADFAVEVAHAGAVDAYRLVAGDEGRVLVPVRTSTTTPG